MGGDPAGFARAVTPRAFEFPADHAIADEAGFRTALAAAAGRAARGDLVTLGILTEENVVAQLNHLSTHPSVAAKLASGQLFIHGWVYDIETSAIRAYDAERGTFLPLDGAVVPMATPTARYPQQ